MTNVGRFEALRQWEGGKACCDLLPPPPSSAQYSTVEEAVATRTALHGVKWPQSNPKFLCADYAEQDEVRNQGRGKREEVGRPSSARLQLETLAKLVVFRVLLPPLWFPELSRESAPPAPGPFSGVMLLHPCLLCPQLDYHRGLWWTGPLKLRQRSRGCHGHYTPRPTPNPATTAPQGRTVGAGAGGPGSSGQNGTGNGAAGATRSEREWDRDKVREGPPDPDPGVLISRRKERAKSKERRVRRKVLSCRGTVPTCKWGRDPMGWATGSRASSLNHFLPPQRKLREETTCQAAG